MKSLLNIFRALTRREQIIFFAVSGAFLASAIALAVFVIGKNTKVVPARGGEYREGMTGQPKYINPVLAATDADKALVRLVFSNLPDIADTIASDKNGQSWKVRLKENIRWSDGEKITADDVIFTVATLQNPESQSPLFTAWQGVSANRASELEIQFNLAAPYPLFSENLKNLYLVPKHIFGETPPANWRLSDYNFQPIGSGPYKIDSYEKQPNGFIAAYRLSANKNYSGAAPFIPNVLFRFFSNAGDLVKDFNAGMIDGFGDPGQDLAEKIKRPYRTIAFHLPSYYAVFLNQSQNIALKENAVRTALSLAVDREALIVDALRGGGTPVTGPFPPFILSDESSTAPAPDAARDLLERNGWKLNADGVREKTMNKKGIALGFDLVVPKVPFLVKTADALKKSWGGIGVKINLVALAPEEIASRIIKNREYQALLFGNVLGPAFDLYPFWHSTERFYPGLNLALYASKQTDQSIESIRKNANAEKRSGQMRELRALIAGDAPAVFLYSPDYSYITTKDLKGVSAGILPDPADRFRAAPEWYVKTTRALR